MTLQRRFIHLLDRPCFRPLLAFLASWYARRTTGLDVGFVYDEGWIHRADDHYLAEALTFFWNADQVRQWKPGLAEILDRHRDWWFHQYQPKAGDIILDIGAGVGEDALLFSKTVGPRGRVVAVEAHPITFRLLRNTCQRNRLTSNTVCIHGALMDKTGTTCIDKRPDYSSRVGARDGLVVPAVSLDELCLRQNIQRVDFMKINIEGAERFAIQGMTRMIAHTRALCIACHDFRGHEGDFYRTKRLVTEFVRVHGFDAAFREQHPEAWVRDTIYGIRSDAPAC